MVAVILRIFWTTRVDLESHLSPRAMGQRSENKKTRRVVCRLSYSGGDDTCWNEPKVGPIPVAQTLKWFADGDHKVLLFVIGTVTRTRNQWQTNRWFSMPTVILKNFECFLENQFRR